MCARHAGIAGDTRGVGGATEKTGAITNQIKDPMCKLSLISIFISPFHTALIRRT